MGLTLTERAADPLTMGFIQSASLRCDEQGCGLTALISGKSTDALSEEFKRLGWVGREDPVTYGVLLTCPQCLDKQTAPLDIDPSIGYNTGTMPVTTTNGAHDGADPAHRRDPHGVPALGAAPGGSQPAALGGHHPHRAGAPVSRVQEALHLLASLSLADAAELAGHLQVTTDHLAIAVRLTHPANSLYRVYLTEVGEKKIQVIKLVREVTGMGLREAKYLVDAAPYKGNGTAQEVVANLTLDNANEVVKRFAEQGAVAAAVAMN